MKKKRRKTDRRQAGKRRGNQNTARRFTRENDLDESRDPGFGRRRYPPRRASDRAVKVCKWCGGPQQRG